MFLCCPPSDLKMKDNSIITHNQTLNFFKPCIGSKIKYIEDDVVDNPKLTKKAEEKSPERSQYFEIMKVKKNRLDSFEGKWPVPFIKSTDMAEAGFFYLQVDDKVQCAFCKLILHSWALEDDPLKEHKKNFPDCPFLMTGENEAKNIVQKISSNYCSEHILLPSTSGSSKPKHPQFSDIKNRLMTFKEWSHPFISAKDLADCGFYYIGMKDFVTCFFCGGTQGFWEPSDKPVSEHLRIFPKCGFLRFYQNRPIQHNRKTVQQHDPTKMKKSICQPYKQILIEELLKSQVVKEAKEIFPPEEVDDIVFQQVEQTGKGFASLHQLCEKVLERDEKRINMNSNFNGEVNKPVDECQNSKTSKTLSTKDLLLCKICMDKEKGVVFQPCGHLASCESCAAKITKCPICRTTVENVVRTYFC